MPRLLTAIAMTLAVALALTAGPAPVAACQNCEPNRSTPTTYGTGATCTQARNNLYANAAAMISCATGETCAQALHVTIPCRSWNGTCRVDGHITYSCLIDYCGLP